MNLRGFIEIYKVVWLQSYKPFYVRRMEVYSLFVYALCSPINMKNLA